MKFHQHYIFYLAAVISIVGMLLGWEWVKGSIDGWFPMFAAAMGEITRLRNGVPAGWLEHNMQRSRKLTFVVVALPVLWFAAIGAYGAYLVYVKHPADNQAGIEEYLEARAKNLEMERNK